MRTRSPLWSQGVVRHLTKVALIGGGLALAVQGCDRTPTRNTRAGDGPLHLALSTSVVAAPGAVVEAIVNTVGSGATTLSRDSVITDTGGADASLSLSANVSSCVASAPEGAACQLDLIVRLKRNGAVLDEATQRLTVGPEDEAITAQPVQLYEVATVRITGPAAALNALEPRDNVQLTATAIDRNGATVAGRTATWSVVSGGVTVGATTGLMNAVSVGSAVVRAAMGGRNGDLAVTVRQTSVDTVRVAPLDTTINIGNSFPYRVTLKSGYNDVLTGRPVTYSSSSPGIATVSPAGVATAIATGTTTITVTSTEGRGGATVTGTATLRVAARPQLVVNPATLTFQTALNTPLPPAQTVAVTNPGGGTADPISIVPLSDTVVVASLDRTTLPATITVRATTALGPGTAVTREVRVRSAQAGVTDAVVNVTVQGLAVPQGVFSGLVANASTSAPIAGATVAIRRAADQVQVATATTGSNGAWTSIALPAGNYSLVVSAAGFTSVTLAQVSLAGGANIPVTTVAPVLLVPTGAGNGIISGAVRDATTNIAVAGATVELRAGANNTTGPAVASASTSASGLYSFPAQPAGTYTVRASRTGYSDGVVAVTVSGSPTTAPTVFLSPATSGTAWRFVLQWGATPSDLDAHLTGPIQGSQSRFHVYFGDPGALTESPFAQLDFDVVTGSGPETVTIGQQIAGTYRFYVHNYSGEFGGDTPISASGARVSVYQANTLVATYPAPQQPGVYWTVFEITNGILIPINTVGNGQPSLTSPLVGPRNPSAAREAAAAEEWYNLKPWTWLKKPR